MSDIVMENDKFITLLSPSEGYYSELRSKFISYAYPLKDESDAKELVSKLKNKYHDARHIAYAYRLGFQGDVFRANDDGEPSGTAGKPILGQIKANGLVNVIVVVVRYFGGVKLGTSRLAEAYKIAAADALGNADFAECFMESSVTLRFGYERMSAVMKIVKDMGVKIEENGYDETCVLKVRMRNSLVEPFCERMDRTVIIEKE